MIILNFMVVSLFCFIGEVLRQKVFTVGKILKTQNVKRPQPIKKMAFPAKASAQTDSVARVLE